MRHRMVDWYKTGKRQTKGRRRDYSRSLQEGLHMMKGKKEILNNMTCETDQHRRRSEEAAHLSVVSGVLRCSELV